jgi:hypothetical protein
LNEIEEKKAEMKMKNLVVHFELGYEDFADMRRQGVSVKMAVGDVAQEVSQVIFNKMIEDGWITEAEIKAEQDEPVQEKKFII